MEVYVATITTDASGAATWYTPVASGNLEMIMISQDATNNYTTAYDVLITGENTGVLICGNAASNTTSSAGLITCVRPRATGALQADFSSSSDSLIPIWLWGERMKIVIANGGNTKSAVWRIAIHGSFTGSGGAS